MRYGKIMIFLIIFIIISISIIFINPRYNGNININPKTDIDANTNVTNTNTTNTTSAFVPKVVCEECHMSGKSSIPQALNVKPHLNGGNYCLKCHKFNHDQHPINKDVTCEKCHGFKNESIPVSGPNIVCINCHDYPNPLNRSNGNLITIHRERNVSCINCHADTCTKCHNEVGTSDRWQKRFIHFNTILGALPQNNLTTS